MVKVYYNEFDPFAVLWLKELIVQGYLPKGDVDSRSIKDVRATDIVGYDQLHFFTGIGGWPLALAGAGWGDRPVLTGSCPCQSFSSAGKRRGFADERHLWPEMFRLIKECRPDTIFGEQVASKDALAWLDLVQDEMEGLDYAFGAATTPACGVGAPHIRQRLYWVASAEWGTEWMEDAERQRRGRGNDGYSPRPGGRAFPETKTTGSSGAGGLADADQQGISGGRVQRPREGYCESDGAALQRFEGLCPNGGLADAESGGRGEERPDAGGMREGVNPSGDVAGGLVSGGGASGMGNTICSRRQPKQDVSRCNAPGMEQGGIFPQQSCQAVSSVGGLDDAESIGRGVCDAENVGAPNAPGHVSTNPSHLSVYGELISTGAGGVPGAVNGYWRDADWLFCRDAKWRPIKSGSTALVNGISPGVGSGRTGNRTQRLKGYGNAIVVPLAIEFIKAFLEAETDG